MQQNNPSFSTQYTANTDYPPQATNPKSTQNFTKTMNGKQWEARNEIKPPAPALPFRPPNKNTEPIRHTRSESIPSRHRGKTSTSTSAKSQTAAYLHTRSNQLRPNDKKRTWSGRRWTILYQKYGKQRHKANFLHPGHIPIPYQALKRKWYLFPHIPTKIRKSLQGDT